MFSLRPAQSLPRSTHAHVFRLLSTRPTVRSRFTATSSMKLARSGRDPTHALRLRPNVSPLQRAQFLSLGPHSMFEMSKLSSFETLVSRRASSSTSRRTSTNTLVPARFSTLFARLFASDAKTIDRLVDEARRLLYRGPVGGSGGRGRFGGGRSRRSFQIRVPYLDPKHALILLVVLNVLVFLAWQSKSFRQLRFMRRHFVGNLENLSAGRVHTLLTSCFSHMNLGHGAINMLVLYFMGSGLPQLGILGLGIIGIYALAGISGTLTHIGYQAFKNSQRAGQRRWGAPMDIGAIGASGAVNGITSVFALARPQTTFLLYGIIPVPAIICLAGLVGYDLYGTFFLRDNISHVGHLGGAAFGAVYFLLNRGRL